MREHQFDRRKFGWWEDHPRYYRPTADRAINFIRRLRHPKSGQPLPVLPWYEMALRPFFGILKPDGTRQYRFCIVFVPKRNRKSTLGAALAPYCTLADGPVDPSTGTVVVRKHALVPLIAADRDQASIMFKDSAWMTEDLASRSKLLRRRIKVQRGYRRIIDLQSGSECRVFSAESRTKHGYSPSHLLIDEIHSLPGSGLWKVWTEGTDLAETQQAIFAFSTANFKQHSPLAYELHKKCIAHLDGEDWEEDFLPVEWSLKPGQDWKDPAVHEEVNPGLGVAIIRANFDRWFQKALVDKETELEFRRLGLNEWLDEREELEESPISAQAWEAAYAAGRDELEILLRGRQCYGAIDLWSKFSCTCLGLLFPPAGCDPQWYWLSYFFLPEANAQERQEAEGAKYQQWISEGAVMPTEGSVIDLPQIREQILWAAGEFELLSLGYHERFEHEFCEGLADDGVNTVVVRQGYGSLADPTNQVLGMAFGKKIAHDGNPAMEWMLSNLRLGRNSTDEKKPHSRLSLGPIAGARALIWARLLASEDGLESIDEHGGALGLVR